MSYQTKQFSMEALVRKELLTYRPYTPGEQPSFSAKTIKLNTNENPYPPSPKIKEAVEKVLETGVLRKYPNYHGRKLQELIAKDYDLDPDQILVTNGSDEALRLLFQALIGPGDVVVAPDPTYSFYPVLTEQMMVGATYNAIPLKSNLHFDFESLEKEKGKLLCFAHPNAPTGVEEPKDKLLNLVKNFSGIVLSDEAYIDFTEPNSSLISEIKNHPNLVVSRTFSKSYALAGLRVGYLVGSLEVISWIRKLKDSYNVGILEQVVAEVSYSDKEYFLEKRSLVIRERENLKIELESNGFEIPKSSTNFLFCKPKLGVSPESLYLRLKEKNILIRYFSTGISKDYIRITIGTKEENKLLLEMVRELM
ncbi:histidinol-phosphate transaminase [Leptospira sp. 2 VSF19]|uniref:Histidinol-phosphate aminotransferase n=1 Tax=Leptospira soteropolitanensis TaxID=2950025 RepID=A0AAW5VFV4_9LEPT|nr:histidinol-phosphate transaminase [Leptospira soteropolitanensis]MCW7492042.1 histidinol-phosphate transaminase [Leptospira soteropolitanensis]MCW7499624.1 histidinol-phosphate transaminase [Leptospira soteropolitanensis]MCW7521875.1 histidinol-phosphate transaminase [Leptospira soteropolitanensis]MCW7525729.1 histidinol-phosphate transaminase [Leptospira soteropolitanensis]MCW7530157.1 histidinol-phosphate transaminase [Leptospira soteropolitanensis]